MKIKHILAAAGAGLALVLGGCANPAGAQASAEATTPAATGPALWKVSDADTTIYLFGTVHVLPEGVNWYDQRIQRAFEASDTLVTEVDVGEQSAMAAEIARNAALPAGQTLRSLMTDEDREQYEAAMTGMGLPPAALDNYEPWFAALNLGVLPLLQAGYDPSTGVEMALSERAGDKQRGALETVQQQIDLFDGMDQQYQLTYLDTTVESVPEVVPMVGEMVSDWLAGDADGLAAIMNGEIDDAYLYNRLLIDRNANWADWIKLRLEQPGTVFIAVGAGHLAGTGSVQDQLAQRGLAVTRITQ